MEIRQTQEFARWLDGLRDLGARARVQARIERLIWGNPADIRPIRGGICELRIDYGPGYRVYLLPKGQTLTILLAGGDKSSQNSDIEKAISLAKNLDQAEH